MTKRKFHECGITETDEGTDKGGGHLIKLNLKLTTETSCDETQIDCLPATLWKQMFEDKETTDCLIVCNAQQFCVH
eukprot:15339467-Ditylum_brightwellii.AAC.1